MTESKTEDIMSWNDKISSAFGVADKKFAGHANDIESAVELLEMASKEGVSFADYLTDIKAWLKSQDCSPQHIEQGMGKVNDLSSYFKT